MRIINIIMTGFFTVEAIIKIVAFGFLFNGPDSYLRSGANMLDFFIVTAAILDISLSTVNFSFIKIVRMARLSRPMKLILRNPKLKISI